MAIGLGVIVLSGLPAAAGGVHFDGLLDFHVGRTVTSWLAIVEGLVNWSVITALLTLVAMFVAPRTVRLFDIAGTQALALFVAAVVLGEAATKFVVVQMIRGLTATGMPGGS